MLRNVSANDPAAAAALSHWPAADGLPLRGFLHGLEDDERSSGFCSDDEAAAAAAEPMLRWCSGLDDDEEVEQGRLVPPPVFPLMKASNCEDRTMDNSACVDDMSIMGGNIGTLVPGMVGVANGNPGFSRLPSQPLSLVDEAAAAAAAAAAVAADSMPKFKPFREGMYLHRTRDRQNLHLKPCY